MKLKLIFLSLIFILVPIMGVSAQAERRVLEDKIQDFQVVIQLQSDGSFEVREVIDYDFGLEGKHGIIRDIPTSYLSKLGSYKIFVSDIRVDGRDFEIEKLSDKVRLRIGDETKLFQGQQRYDIKYSVERGIGYFSTFDEFYWNAVGGVGTARANHSAVAVLLPAPIAPADIKAACYVGEFNATEKCLMAEPSLNDQGQVIAIKFAEENLGAGQGLSISVALPKGLMAEMPWWRQTIYFFQDRMVATISLLLLIVIILKRGWIKSKIIKLTSSFRPMKPKE